VRFAGAGVRRDRPSANAARTFDKVLATVRGDRRFRESLRSEKLFEPGESRSSFVSNIFGVILT